MSGTPPDLTSVRQALLKTDFDVEKHASELIQNGCDISQYLQDLTAAEQQLDEQIQDQVSTHYEDLLRQATGVEKLESHLDMMQTHMATLVSATERVRGKIREPYKALRTQTLTLARLQETCDLSRRIIRVLQLSKRLHGQLQAGPHEMTKAALSINELSELWTPELNSIDIIEQDQRVILHAKTDLERNADGMLTRGMESQNQSQIGIAIQVFQNLSLLEKKLDGVRDHHVKDIRKRMNEALDVKKITSTVEEGSKSSSSGGPGGSSGAGGPGRAAMPVMGNMATFRAILWNNMETMLEVIYNKNCEMVCLQKLLGKKRDAVSHTSFIQLLPANKGQVCRLFWDESVKIIKNSLSTASEDSNFLKQALEGEYPKLLRLFNDLWARLHQVGNDLGQEDIEQLDNPFKLAEMDSKLRETLGPFERAYLSRSLSRLFDPVNLLFSAGEIPSENELLQVFKGISSELNVSLVDLQLSLTVSKNVAKTIQLMCVKCEQIVVTDGEASQVVGYPTEGQKKNVEVVNCMCNFRAGVEDIVKGIQLSAAGVDSIQEALKDIDKQVYAAIMPLLSSIQDAVEAIILTLHKEDFSSAEETSTDVAAASCSLYMKELQTFLSRVSTDFLQEFVCQYFIQDCLVPVATKCVNQFILHSSLVRPLGKAGQLTLASDCAQLELALEPLVGKASADVLGESYRTLRAFRSLLFMVPEDVPDCPLLGQALPFSIALHFLFSKAPPELKSPHDSAGWSLSRYSNWLEDHPAELERLQLIEGTLESYVAGTRARQEKSYAQPYPIMLQILQKGLKEMDGQ